MHCMNRVKGCEKEFMGACGCTCEDCVQSDRADRPKGDYLTWLVTWQVANQLGERWTKSETIYSESFEHALEQLIEMRKHSGGIMFEDGFRFEFVGRKYVQRHG